MYKERNDTSLSTFLTSICKHDIIHTLLKVPDDTSENQKIRQMGDVIGPLRLQSPCSATREDIKVNRQSYNMTRHVR